MSKYGIHAFKLLSWPPGLHGATLLVSRQPMRHHSRFPAQTRVASQDIDIGRGPNGREEIGACLHRAVELQSPAFILSVTATHTTSVAMEEDF